MKAPNFPFLLLVLTLANERAETCEGIPFTFCEFTEYRPLTDCGVSLSRQGQKCRISFLLRYWKPLGDGCRCRSDRTTPPATETDMIIYALSNSRPREGVSNRPSVFVSFQAGESGKTPIKANWVSLWAWQAGVRLHTGYCIIYLDYERKWKYSAFLLIRHCKF